MTNNEQPEFDKYAEKYEADLKQSIPLVFNEDKYFSEYKIHHIARQLGKQLPGRLLDFGCGIGLSLSLLNMKFPNAELWGYDVSKKSLKLASRCSETLKLTSNIEDLPIAGFDVIFAANVFHHIPVSEREEAFLICKRLLRDGGRLFLFEHNPLNPLTRMVFERCSYDEGAVMLRQREVLNLAAKVGLSVTRSDYTLFFPRQLAFLRSFERSLGWLPLGAQYCVEMIKKTQSTF